MVDLPVLENVSEDYQQVKEELAEGGIPEHVNQSSLAVVNSRLVKDVQELLAHHNEEKSQIFRSFGLPVPDVHSLHKAKSPEQVHNDVDNTNCCRNLREKLILKKAQNRTKLCIH